MIGGLPIIRPSGVSSAFFADVALSVFQYDTKVCIMILWR